MSQSKIESNIEAFLNTGSGFVISWCVWEFVAAPIFGIKVDHGQTFWITTIFTVTSYYRSYYWRRFFNANGHKYVHNFVKKWLPNSK